MKEISDVTCCVVDSGLFMNMADIMGRDCKKVYLWSPDCRAFPSVNQACIGEGFYTFERIRDFWPLIDEIDLFCFPDIGQAELQYVLANDFRKAVWGSRIGDDLELKREFFLEKLGEWGLEVPEHTVVEGLDELESFLGNKEDYYVKVSRFRGDFETHHWRDYEMDIDWIHQLRVSLGPIGDHIRFLCFPAIETDIEIGADAIYILGRWPKLMLNGFEGKDKTYFSKVTPKDEMPSQVQEVMLACEDWLEVAGYRNQISFEIRVQGDKFYWIDATQRGGLPSTGTQHLIWKNFPEVVWHGANGELLEPEPAATYSIETKITTEREPGTWERVILPEELEGLARFNGCCKVDGVYCFPPSEFASNELGWLVAIGDTPSEVVERQKALADLLPDGLNADIESLASVIKEIDTAKKEGVPFTQQAMPEPASVL